MLTLVPMDDAWLTRLNEAVKADGRAMRAVSLAAGLGPNYVSEVFSQGKVPSIDKLLKLCSELNVSATFILTGVEINADAEEMLQLLSVMTEDQQETLLSLARQLRAAAPR